MLTLSAMQAQFGLELGIPQDVQATALAYLVVVMESTHDDRLDEDVTRSPSCSTRSERRTCTSCRPAPRPS